MLGILICFLVLESAEFGRDAEGLLQLPKLRLQVDQESKHNDDVEALAHDCVRVDITEAYDGHRHDNVIKHVMVAVNVNVFVVVLVRFVVRLVRIMPVVPFLAHRLVESHVLNGHHAGGKQKDDDDEGEGELEGDPDHLRLEDRDQAEDGEQPRHPEQLHVTSCTILDHRLVCYHLEGDQGRRDQRQISEETLHTEDVNYSVLRNE